MRVARRKLDQLNQAVALGDLRAPPSNPSTALRLAKALGTTPQFWLNGQLALDLYQVSHDEEELRQLERIEPISL